MEFVSIENFPKNKIYILLYKEYLKKLIKNSMNKLNCRNYFELSCWINKKLNTKINGGMLNIGLMEKGLTKEQEKLIQSLYHYF